MSIKTEVEGLKSDMEQLRQRVDLIQEMLATLAQRLEVVERAERANRMNVPFGPFDQMGGW